MFKGHLPSRDNILWDIEVSFEDRFYCNVILTAQEEPGPLITGSTVMLF